MTQHMTLLDNPDWNLAAQALADGCSDLPDDDARVALLEAVCSGLGDSLYPAFLRILALVGRFGDYPARGAVACALVHGLRTGRLPVGKLGAWGHSGCDTAGTGFSQARSLGPVEYLCVWHAQAPVRGDAMVRIEPGLFHQAASALLNLIDAAPDARRLYAEMLLSVVDDPLDGTLNRATRQALGALAVAWQGNATSAEASASFLAALQTEASSTLSTLAAQTMRNNRV